MHNAKDIGLVDCHDDLSYKVAARYLTASYFNIGDKVLIGKYKNGLALISGFGKDKWGNPTVILEPITKDGRKRKPKEIGLFKIWRADVKENALKALADSDKIKLAKFKPNDPVHLGNFLSGWYNLESWTREITLLHTLAKNFSYSGIAYRAPSISQTFCPSSWSKSISALKTFLAETKGLIVRAKLTGALDLEMMAKHVINETKTKDSDVHDIKNVRELVCLTVPSTITVVQEGKPYAEL